MTSTALKIIAAITMLIDHAGLILFPQYRIFRIIGRLAFPIYAYCIAEGFRYTKNRKRYFMRIFALGTVCQIIYTLVEKEVYLGILITFSLSIGLMALTDKVLSSEGKRRVNWGAALILAVLAVYLLTLFVPVDYGFFGVMLPVFASLFKDKPRRLATFTLGLLPVCFFGGTIQFFSLFALLPPVLYNGKQGKYPLKNFFYLFYPAHLVFLYGVEWMLTLL